MIAESDVKYLEFGLVVPIVSREAEYQVFVQAEEL